MGFGTRLWRIFPDEPPERFLVFRIGDRGEVQQHRVRHNHVILGRLPAMNMPCRIVRRRRLILPSKAFQMVVVFINRFRDHVKIHPLGGFGLLIHEIRQAFRAGIGQPFINRQPVALGFADFLAILIEEQLIGEMLRLAPAQNLANLVINGRVGGMVLAIHLEIDIQSRPARAEIRLPLQFHIAAGHRQRGLSAILVVKGNRAILGIHIQQRHIQNAARLWRNRQKDRIGLLAFLAQAGQHDLHQIVIAFGGAQQHLVKPAILVKIGRADELILKAERIQKTAQHGIVVVAEAFKLAERVGHHGQRALQMRAQHFGLGHIVGDLAHPVHIVRKTDQPRGNVRNHLEGPADHRGARHFAKRADMRQAGGAVAGFKQHIALFGRLGLVTLHQPARLFKGPGFAVQGGVTKCGHDNPRAWFHRFLLKLLLTVNKMRPNHSK